MLASIAKLIRALPAAAARLRRALFLRNECYDLYGIPLAYRIRLRCRQWLFGEDCAYGRGMRLLLENLSPAQRQEFLRFGHFSVIGGDTGQRYRICRGRQMNVHQLDRKGGRICIWCFYPAGGLVDGDVMLAQKLALELYESTALTKANRLAYYFENTAAL